MELKQPLSYEEQIKHLREYHNLSIEDNKRALQILSDVNYYRLSAYGLGLMEEDNPEQFIEGVTLESIYRLYQFDGKLRTLLYKAIEFLEVQLRTQIAYYIAMNYGAEGYIDANNFEYKVLQSGVVVHDSIIEHFNNERNRQKNLPIVKHHEEKYEGHYPVWVALELFTFGNLVSLYSIMKPDDRKAIAKQYGVDYEYLKSWVLSLVEMRNICAHYGRIYNMPLKQKPRLYKEYRQYQTTVTRLFPLIIAMKKMFNGRDEWFTFSNGLSDLLSEYVDDVQLSFIAFPKNWRDVLEID